LGHISILDLLFLNFFICKYIFYSLLDIREKFWKIGNKERDGEYGACFFPGKCSGSQQPLIYCARPGSRIWEVNFDGEVLSTHQFKKLLSSPPLPVITPR
jgi:hypothetical protein